MEKQIKKIFTAPDNLQAEMILTALSNNGIACYKQDVDSNGFLNIYAGGSNCREDIFVAEENETKALEILEEMGLHS